ncbi:PP2C family protein-serine/threonine phosphatase [Streptomyces sp. O3]
MRGGAGREHPGRVTRKRAASRASRGGGGAATPGSRVGDSAAGDVLGPLLTRTCVQAVEAVGGHAGSLYLCSRTSGLLKLAVIAGLPVDLFHPWRQMHVNRPFPVAHVHRSGRPVSLADSQEAMRRYPQLMAGLPFDFGSLYAPVSAGRERYGVLVAVREATPGVPVTSADRRRMLGAARRLGGALAELAAGGVPVRWDGDPVSVSLPTAVGQPVRTGRFTWDLDLGLLDGDDELCAILGLDPAELPGTAGTLGRRLPQADAYGLWAAVRQAAGQDRPGARRVRILDAAGRPHLVELTAHRARPRQEDDDPGRSRGGTRGRLTGTLMDLGTGAAAAGAPDQIPTGVVSTDRMGRVTHANDRAESLLGLSGRALSGRVLWDAVPWLTPAAYEDEYRSALLSLRPVRFAACRKPGQWLSVAVLPGRDGLTATFTAAEEPAYTPVSTTRPGPGLGSPADRAAALYRPVALAIALTEAVTARQVSAVVTDELLPAFGGRQLAIYLLRDDHLYLAWETGFPRGFLDRFDGVGLDARLPGVETLTTGRPIFFESMEHLAASYPGIPLDAHTGARAFLPLIASGRPVGSCILGFDQPRGFSPEDRTVLTALAGLIAQALERARRYDSEAALARGLQDALLPHRLPERDDVDTVGRYLPGTQGMDVGGDWYDVVATERGLALVIGDVQGHGVAAAATMGQLRSAVRAFALAGRTPQEVMRGTNRLLIDLEHDQIASCCYIVLDPVSGVAQAVRAGHPQPLLRHPDGHTEVLDLAGGVVLGVSLEASYDLTELRLPPGAILALYTDGLVEQPGADIDQGVERLRAALARVESTSLSAISDTLISEARTATERPDDIALLLAGRRAGGG